MKSLIRHAAATLALSSALVGTFTHAIPGQPGTLDATWATSSPLGAGKVITPVGASDDGASALALQPDGKVVVAGGGCYDGTIYGFCAVRYNANGTPDASFGSGGKVITLVGTSYDYASAIALQPDGRLVLAGQCNNGTNVDFCALRYNANGTLDTSFGSGGKVITPAGINWDTANALALQPDGKLVLAGACYSGTSYDFCAQRYLANGALDTSFGSGGKVITPVGAGLDFAYAIALQPDGKLVLAGYCSNGTNNDFCALRYNANGTLDTSFGSGGSVITPVGTSIDQANALALQPDGKLVLAGYCVNGLYPAFCALRYRANGTLDASFGTAGKVVTPFSMISNAGAIALQPDGKVVLAGTCTTVIDAFCALRYHANGTLDTSFGGGGTVITPVGTVNDVATALAVQPDGKLLLVGNCSNGTDNDFCAIRYDGGPFGYQNCKLDLDGDGSVLASTDMLIGTRIALGITGPAVINGITFPATATRNTWPLIRDYLVTQCGMSLVQ